MSHLFNLKYVRAANTEWRNLFTNVHERIKGTQKEVTFLGSSVLCVNSFNYFFPCCESLLKIQRDICDILRSLQNLNISSSKVVGFEIGPVRIRLPLKLSFNLRRSWRKKALDSLITDLQNVFQQCLTIRHVLHSVCAKLNAQNVHLINESESNQCKWSLKMMKALTMALEWNQDSLLLLKNLIDWDYEHRFFTVESYADPMTKGNTSSSHKRLFLSTSLYTISSNPVTSYQDKKIFTLFCIFVVMVLLLTFYYLHV